MDIRLPLETIAVVKIIINTERCHRLTRRSVGGADIGEVWPRKAFSARSGSGSR